MPRSDSSLNMLIVAAVVALGVGYYVPQTLSSRPSDLAKAESSGEQASSKSSWAASAPGRVEPLGGEVHMGSLVPGRIAEVLVGINDKVVAGDLLVRLDDEELIARVQSAAAEAAVRKRDRDNNDAVGKPAQDRRVGEDGVANMERHLQQAHEELDRLQRSFRNGTASAADLDKAREAVGKANDRLEQARATLRKALAADQLPAPTRTEAALTAARADLSTTEAALERARIRAGTTGTVLQVTAKVGEIVTPSPENVLVSIGNLASLRVRAEFEERDLPRVRVGQTAVVRSDAFPGKDFEGKVAVLSPTLGPSRLGQRGPRRPTDVDVLEALIDLVGQPGLLPGMRVDVFLKAGTPAAAAPRRPATAQSR
jgi:HlyD family secretion protein